MKNATGAKSRSNSPAAPATKSMNAAPQIIITSPVKQPTRLVTKSDLAGGSKALLGLLIQQQPVRTLSPFPKPSLNNALQAARFVPVNQPRKILPVPNRGQKIQNPQFILPVPNRGQKIQNPQSNVNPALISVLASSAAKDAMAKFGPNTVAVKPSSNANQGKGKGYDRDEDFKSKAKVGASSISTRPKRGKQRRNFSDLLDDSEEESSEVHLNMNAPYFSVFE